jgi:hypothetical protein
MSDYSKYKFIVAKIIALQISHFTESGNYFHLFAQIYYPVEMNILIRSILYIMNKLLVK